MSQTTAHLVDHVIPNVPARQRVLSLPIELRLLLAAQPGVLGEVDGAGWEGLADSIDMIIE